MSNPAALYNLLVKVERAHTHFKDLRAEIDRLTSDDPYETFFEDDANTGKRTYYLRVHKEMPSLISGLIGDCGQNLRSALDHLAWHLVQNSPVTPKARDSTFHFRSSRPPTSIATRR